MLYIADKKKYFWTTTLNIILSKFIEGCDELLQKSGEHMQ